MTFLDESGLIQLWQSIQAKLSYKVDKESGKGLSTNDFTNEDKEKITSLEQYISSIDYENSLAFDVNEIVFENNNSSTTALLGKAILGQMILGSN